MSTQMQAPETPGPPGESGQQTSVLHLVMGLVFLGIAGAWALHAAGVIESVEVQWLMPLILIVAGAAGLLVSLTRGVSRGASRRGSTEPGDG